MVVSCPAFIVVGLSAGRSPQVKTRVHCIMYSHARFLLARTSLPLVSTPLPLPERDLYGYKRTRSYMQSFLFLNPTLPCIDCLHAYQAYVCFGTSMNIASPRSTYPMPTSPVRRKSAAMPGFRVPPKPKARPIEELTIRELRDLYERNARILSQPCVLVFRHYQFDLNAICAH